MYIPDKNDSPQDFVRMLAPTRSYGEKDLDAHLVSTYAKDIDKPAFEVPYLVDKKKPAAGQAAEVKPPDEEDSPPDDDEIVEDFEMRFAKQLVSSVSASTRPKLVAGAGKLVASVRGDEEKKLVAALQTIGVDWSAAPPAAGKASLDVSVTASPSGSDQGRRHRHGDRHGQEHRHRDRVSRAVAHPGRRPGVRGRRAADRQGRPRRDQDVPRPGCRSPGRARSRDRLGVEVREAHKRSRHVTPASSRSRPRRGRCSPMPGS
jgi:hypothetical protein